jgi:hypothetical protein
VNSAITGRPVEHAAIEDCLSPSTASARRAHFFSRHIDLADRSQRRALNDQPAAAS